MTKKNLIITLIIIAVIVTGAFAFKHFNKSTTASNNISNANSYKCGNMTLNYIPEGFELTYNESGPSTADLVFEKNELYFIISLNNITANMNVDTEASTVENIYINKNEGVYIEKKKTEEKILVWHYGREYVFDITGNIPKEDMFKIAENAANPKL